jgi:glutamyl-tRNA reductase
VRSAARAAEDHGAMGPRLRALFGAAVATARRAHRETALATLGRSVGRAAVDAAFEGLAADRPQIAVIGTGRMARVVVERLAELDIEPAVYGRSVERAERLSQRTALVRGIDQIPSALRRADVVFCATSASSHLVTATKVQLAMRARPGRPLTVLDLSVPANVDPFTGAVPGVRLVDIDDLRDAPAPSDRVELDAALDDAQAIVAAALRRFDAARHGRVIGPVIAQLQQRAEEAFRRSLRQQRPDLVVDGTIDQVARALARRHVHRSIVDVREAARRDDADAIERILRTAGATS